MNDPCNPFGRGQPRREQPCCPTWSRLLGLRKSITHRCRTEPDSQTAPKAVQQPAARSGTDSQETRKAPENKGFLPIVAAPCNTAQMYKVPPRGVEQIENSSGNQGVAPQGGAESGALGAENGPKDPELGAIIHAWPTLPDAIKAGILAMVRAAGGMK